MVQWEKVGEDMVKRFRFDDEDNVQVDEQQLSHIDELENMKQDEPFQEEEVFNDLNEDEQSMKKKKKKKFKWKWWHNVLVIFGVCIIALAVYILVISLHEGPVYGNRCEGMVTISQDIRDSAIAEIKETYSEIEDITFEIACRQLKVDITFEDGMDTEEAKEIAEASVQILDRLAGYTVEDGKTYSQLFGTIDNVSQYEVNLILYSNDSEDFPIYGTKHTQKDSFSYTLASIKDEESYQKARETLEDSDE